MDITLAGVPMNILVVSGAVLDPVSTHGITWPLLMSSSDGTAPPAKRAASVSGKRRVGVMSGIVLSVSLVVTVTDLQLGAKFEFC
jgi:hypothetical protein